MGPCQGGFCTLRAAGILHQLRDLPIEQTNAALCDFLQERWKGLQPVLWGQQLRQERLDELIYLDVFNLDHLPGPKESRLKSEPYLSAKKNDVKPQTSRQPTEKDFSLPRTSPQSSPTEILVIGAGLSGLIAAWRASSHKKRLRMIAKGWGAHYWGAGCIDVLGYSDLSGEPITSNLSASLEALVRENPRHPYAISGLVQLHAAVNAFQDLCTTARYPLIGTLEQNWLLPTALGSLRPTCLAPETMLAGDGKNRQPTVIVGFDRFFDFYPNMIAANLDAQGIPAQGILLDLPSLRSRKTLSSRIMAQYFESPEFRREVVEQLKPRLRQVFKPGMGVRVGFPAVLGLVNSRTIWQEMQQELECPVFEIPGLPPSIPGMRLHQILCQAIQSQGGEIFEGMQVQKADCTEKEVVTVWSEAAARQKPHRANQYILATGNFLGGGMVCDSDGNIEEVILGLPLKKPLQSSEWFDREFLSKSGHPIFNSGIEVDQNFHPIDENGNVHYQNLSITGSLLADADPIRERSLEGIALATGYTVGERLGGVRS